MNLKTQKCWIWKELSHLLVGSQDIICMVNNNRYFQFSDENIHTRSAVYNNIVEWAEDNITDLWAADVEHKYYIRVFFRNNDDLAKFILAFSDYELPKNEN